MSIFRISGPSSQHQREFLLAKHGREEIERQNQSMLCLVQQKQELDLQRLKRKERMKKEQALMLAELEEQNREKLAEATLAELELTQVVSKANQSLRDAIFQVILHSQKVKSVRLTNCVINDSTEVAK